MSRTSRRRLAAAVAAVAAVAVVAFAGGDGGDDARRRGRVERRDLVITADVEGSLQAVDTAVVGPPAVRRLWNFKIAFLAPEGVEVAAGEPVVRFDTAELQRRLQSAQAEREQSAKELEKLAAELEMARRDLELELAEARARRRRFALEVEVPAEVVARQKLDKARIDRDLAEREVSGLEDALRHQDDKARSLLRALAGRRDRAAADVAELERAMAAMTVTAPRAGTVLYVETEPGVKPKVGDSVWRAATLAEIPDLGRMRGAGVVDEAAMGRLEVGQPVRLRLDAHPDERLAGTLRAIHESVQRKGPGDPRKVVAVEVALTTSAPERLRPAMRFRGEIEVERVPDVVALPLAAVVATAEGPAVEVTTPLGTRRVVPRLGRRDATHVEVLAGLEVGDEVLLPGEADG